MSSQTTHTPSRAPESLAPVTWRAWPLADGAPISWLVPAALIAAGLLADRVTGNPRLGLLATLVLAGALWRFLLPVHFTVSERGVTQRVLGRVRHVTWRAIRCCQVRRAGVMLFRTSEPLPIDALRALYLPWGQHGREVLTLVEKYMAASGPQKGDLPSTKSGKG